MIGSTRWLIEHMEQATNNLALMRNRLHLHQVSAAGRNQAMAKSEPGLFVWQQQQKQTHVIPLLACSVLPLMTTLSGRTSTASSSSLLQGEEKREKG